MKREPCLEMKGQQSMGMKRESYLEMKGQHSMGDEEVAAFRNEGTQWIGIWCDVYAVGPRATS